MDIIFLKETRNYLIYSLFKINSCDLDLKEHFDTYFHSHHILTLTAIWHLNTLYEIEPFILVPFLTSCFMNVLFKGGMLPKQF